MAYLNKVMLIGNIGKDPYINTTSTGRKKVSFSLATTKRYRDSNGEQKEQTEWHNIVVWGKTADIVEQLGIRKGIALYVEGSLTTRKYQDQHTGIDRYVTEILLDTFQVLTPRNQHNGQQQGNGYTQQGNAYGNQQQGYSEEDYLPF